jgi:carbamoyl-phosphate synthase large subunit
MVNVLLTCVGGLVAPCHIDNIKNNPENRDIKIIGTDMDKMAIGRYLVDNFYKVPYGFDENYVDEIKKICENENIDVIIPTSDEESLILSKNKKLFEENGIEVMVSNYDTLEIAFDKSKTFNYLKENKLPCPKFHIARTYDELEKGLDELGFPENKVVIKPPFGRGSRGTRIIVNENLLDTFLKEKPGTLTINYEELKNMFGNLEDDEFPEIVLMEYLSGKHYRVNSLCHNGQVYAVVPLSREKVLGSATMASKIEKNETLINYGKKICESFGFSYCIDIEFGCNEEGIFVPYDFNPRVAEGINFCSVAGANLIYYGIKLALGEEIPEIDYNEIFAMRYLNGFIIDQVEVRVI